MCEGAVVQLAGCPGTQPNVVEMVMWLAAPMLGATQCPVMSAFLLCPMRSAQEMTQPPALQLGGLYFCPQHNGDINLALTNGQRSRWLPVDGWSSEFPTSHSSLLPAPFVWFPAGQSSHVAFPCLLCQKGIDASADPRLLGGWGPSLGRGCDRPAFLSVLDISLLSPGLKEHKGRPSLLRSKTMTECYMPSLGLRAVYNSSG